MLGDRKVGGVLIEHDGDASLIGIGINVSQGAFEPQLAARATSLAQLGAPVDRLAVLEALLPALDGALRAGAAAALDAFRRRDMLRGRRVLLTAAGSTIEGTLESIDPLVALRLRTADGVRDVPASTARIESFG
jgi:biotin-(acetyl-CoA carboxylase) ligase